MWPALTRGAGGWSHGHLDGSPRISGIEALHSASVDPPEDRASWAGDAKVAGRAVLVGPLEGPAPGDLFRADVREVVVTGLNADATLLVIESWTPERGLRRVERK